MVFFSSNLIGDHCSCICTIIEVQRASGSTKEISIENKKPNGSDREYIEVYVFPIWQPPPKNAVKYNIDAGWKQVKAIICFTISDHEGNIIDTWKQALNTTST